MHKENIVVSIIITHYKVKNVLFRCLQNLEKLLDKSTAKCEVIVVDNDEKEAIGNEIKRNFSFVRYIKSPNNKGYGGGNNLGAEQAKGEFLFFLNPDTILLDEAIDSLVNFFNQNNKVGVVAPLLLDSEKNAYKLQGAGDLTFLSAIFSMSFIGKLFPSNPITKAYWNLDWDKKEAREVNVVPGTAFMIRKTIFGKIGGFDESFFLFFEEFDLCKRVRDSGYNIYMLPKANVIHFWGESTKYRKDKDKIFVQSRFYYFKKHFGLRKALLVEAFVSFNKEIVAFLLILFLSFFLRFYRLNELMSFIPDQGWFYLSARDMLLTGEIPLVGPETSHPWIRHGPLWTYALALMLWMFNFNPVPPAYFIAILGVITVLLFYKIISNIYSQRVGFIGALLYATSPLVVFNARTPYHTSPIPFFTILLFFAVYKAIQGNARYIPFVFFLIAILYNHEITTFVLVIPILVFSFYSFWRRKTWIKKLHSKKTILYSAVAFLIPMTPFILYDIQHGFKQTAGFLVWVLYRIARAPLKILNFSATSDFSRSQFFEFISYLQQLIFAPSAFFTITILIVSFTYIAYLFTTRFRKNRTDVATILLCLYLFIPPIGLFLHRIPIEADVLLLSPFIILVISIVLSRIMDTAFLKISVIIVVLSIALANIYILGSQYFIGENAEKRLTISKRLKVADAIIRLANGRAYNLSGKGALSNFPVFTMPYEYLLWWKGHPPKKERTDFRIVVWEKEGEVIVYRER